METEIIKQDGLVIIKVPILIPQSLYEEGAIEQLAIARGWQAEIDGEKNSQSALDFGIARIQNFVKEDYQSLVADMGAEQGRKQALEQFNQAFQSDEK